MSKTKIKQFITWQRFLASMALSLLIVVSLRHPLLHAQAVSQGYSSDQALQRGMIIKLKAGDSTKVETVGADDAERVHGVVVAANDAPVTIAQDGQKIFVATSGRYDILVSTQNGNIVAGDYVSVSSLSGIGMKAGTKEPFVIGRALSNFDAANVISSVEVQDSTGVKKSVGINRIQVDVGIAKNPLLKAIEPNVPQFLQKASTAIAGRPVNAVRVYVGIIVFGITTVVAASLMYGGVRSGIISIGRNPLSRKSIIRGMFQVIVTGLIVFIAGVFGVYLILRL